MVIRIRHTAELLKRFTKKILTQFLKWNVGISRNS